MKIALVAYALNIGGMETFLFSLASEFRAKGHEPFFVVTEYVGAWQQVAEAKGYPVISVLPKWFENKRRHAVRVAATLSRFEVVVINHSPAAQGCAGLLPGATVVISVLHNDDDLIYDCGLAGLENVDRVVAVGERVRAEAVRRGAPEEKVICIRNGVQVPRQYPRLRRRSHDTALKVAFVGRVSHRQKGVLYIPAIARIVRDKGIEATVDVIGDGPDLPLLQAEIARSSVGEMVKTLGALPHEEVMEKLTAYDVLLMPSHFEGQPIVLLEAMARGVVPVVSCLEGITDRVVSHGHTGFLIPVGQESAFAEAICALDDREELEKLSVRCWETAAESFGCGAMAEKYLDLIAFSHQVRLSHDAPQRTGKLDIAVLGKRSLFPQIFHDVSGEARGLISRHRHNRV